MKRIENQFLDISCDFIPVVLNINKSSDKNVKQFATEVSQYIFNPDNDEETIAEFRNGDFKQYMGILKSQPKSNSASPKYFAFFSTIFNSIKNCNISIKEVLFRSSPDEFWVIADSYSEEESEKFYDFAFLNWKDIISNCCVLFIGEEQLNRKQMPSDLLSIIHCR